MNRLKNKDNLHFTLTNKFILIITGKLPTSLCGKQGFETSLAMFYKGHLNLYTLDRRRILKLPKRILFLGSRKDYFLLRVCKGPKVSE